VSGGFGDSNAFDEKTMKILKENQEKVNEALAQLQAVDPDTWETQSVNDTYTMESIMFDYE
jgi:hypothetical protein